MTHLLLDRNWTLEAVRPGAEAPTAVCGRAIPATVPGCVHTDLMAAGLIDDPYLADNELKTAWIGRTDWRYTCRFTLDDAMLGHDRLDLACDGLDTIASVELNGVPIGEAKNMHVRHRFDAKAAAKPGENVLSVTFAAPLDYIEATEKQFGHLPHSGHGSNAPHPHNMIRKMSCNFGWDWGPDLPTCGIWQPIRLEAWSTARIASVRPLVMEATEQRAVVRVHVDVETTDARRVCFSTPNAPPVEPGVLKHTLRLTDPEGRETFSPREEDGVFVFEVEQPRRWWPVGHGEQPLYTLTVALGDDVWSRRIGLRTTELVTEPDPGPVSDPVPDKRGEGMVLKVNGKPIYCKGADWIPDDCFPHRVTPERYRKRITQARDANMNMLRVWGGGLYETEAFYDICDELGVMVWQDFCFACACYPEEEPFWSLVEAEARDNITRLSSHASLVIWNGCNENIWGTFDWSAEWRAMRSERRRTWGLGYYLSLFPKLVAELDPSRPYWPGSPYSGAFDRHPNLNEYGNRHIWDVWHGPGQYRNYLAHYPRMATEFGFHGPPCWPTLARAVPEDQRYWNSPVMRLHNKNGKPGQEQTHTRMCDDFVPPEECFEDWLYLAQVMQARALSMGVEWFRALFPWNSGSLYWQLNDCWPVSSWSAIDGDGRLKPLWYASRRFFADRLVTIKPRRAMAPGADDPGPLAVYLHNDHDARWVGECVLRQVALDGQTLAEHRQRIDVAPRSLAKFDVPDEMHDRGDAVLVADVEPGDSDPPRFCGQGRGVWWFLPDRDLPYPEPRFDATLEPTADGKQRLTITARTLLRDLCVYADRLDPDAVMSDQCVTLLPGESWTVEIASSRTLSVDELTAFPVLNCANRFGSGAPAEGLAEAASKASAVPPSDETGQ